MCEDCNLHALTLYFLRSKLYFKEAIPVTRNYLLFYFVRELLFTLPSSSPRCPFSLLSLLLAFHLNEQTLAKKNYSIRWSISIYIMQPSCLESLLAKLCSEPHREERLDEPEEEEEDVVEEEVVEEEVPVVVYRPPTPPPAPLESRLDRLRSDIRKSSRPWAIAEAFAVSLPVTNDILHGIGGINDEADSLVVSPSKESTESEGKHPSGEVIFEENKEEGDSEHAQPIQALSSVSSISARPVPTEGWARRKSALSRLSVVVIPKDPRQTPTLVKAVPEDQ